MKKRNISLLMVILLFLQLLSPIGETFAAESGVILPPSNLAFTKITPDDGKLTWNSVYEATSYNIYGITEGQLALLGNSKSNNFNLPDLPEGKYNYVVSSLKDNFESGPTAPVEVEIIYPEMLAPTPLSYSIQNGNDIVLNWGESKYAENYNVYSVSASGQKTLIKTTNLRAFSITNVAEGSYSYAVSAANSLYGESVLSATVTANLEYPVMKEPNTASFSISNGSDVTLNWQATSFATGYKIYQVIDGEEILQNTVTAATTVKYSNKSPGDYTYRIYSYSDRFGQSLSGKEIRLTVSSITMVPPSNLSNKIQNTNDVFLSWNQVPYATGYKIYQISNGEKTLKSTVTGTTLTLTNVPGGDYIYEVHSYSDRFGESEAGSQTMFTMNTITMLPPANVSYKIQNGNDIVLSWDAAQNITDYKIYQIVNGQKILKNTVYGTSVTFANMPAGEYIYEVYSNSTKFGASTEGRTISFSLVHPQMNPPVNVIQTINSATSFTLKWDASEYATSYKVYQVINGQKTLKSTVSNPNVSFSNMAPGNYTYEIYASSSKFGDSKTGSLIDVVLNGQVMEAPSNFAFAIKNGNDISLSWNSVPYANSYKVYKLVDGKPVLQSIVYGTNVTYTNQPEGNFTYLVYSVSTLLGESPEGSEIQVNLTHPKMEKPNDLTSKIQNGNDVALTWATVPFANEYKIYELIDGQEIIKATSSTTNKIITNVSEGNHIYIVRSFNARFGQSVEGSQVSTNVVYPIMQTPDNLTKSIVSGNDIRLSWNTVPFATSYKIYQIIDNQRVLKMTVSTPYHVFTNMPEGDYSFEVYSYSDRFGESLKGNAMSHTLVFPVMQAPKNLAQSIFNGNDIQLRWDASTYATGYKIYQVKDGIREFVRTVTGTSNTFVNMPEGNYLYEVHSYSDRFGESPESSKMSLNLTWPVVQPPVLQGAVVNANNIQLTWKAVTWANEYRVYKVSGETKELVYKGTALNFTAYNLSEDTHSYVVTAMSSRFGESQISNLYKETIVYPEMEAPVASLKLLSETSARISWNFVTYANGYNVFEIIDGKPVLIAGKVNNLSYTLQNLSYANHEYYITSYSNSFGESKPSEKVLAKLILDTLPPVTNTDAESQWTTGSQIINLTATDDETGVAKTLYSVNDGSFVEGSTFTIDQEGVNKLSFYSIDKVGNKEDVKTVNVKIDKTLPVTTAELPDGWEVEDFTVVLNATDAQSGVAKTFYSLNGTEFTEGTTLSVNEEGVNSVSFYSVDNAGNKEEVQNVEVKVDKTAPVTKSDAPTTWVKDADVTLTATDAKSGVTKTFYSLNGTEFTEGTTLSVNEEGVNSVSFYSVDNAGNKEEVQNVEVKVDKTAPVTKSDAPTAWVKEADVTLTATDAKSGVTKTFYSLNGTEFTEGTTLFVNEEGVNSVSFYSVDNAGNKEEVQNVEVKVDKTAPETKSDAPTTWVKEADVTLTATDAQSGVAKTFYSLNGSEFKEGTTLSVGEEGINHVSFYSVDNAGNKEETQIVEIKVDKTVPETKSDVPASWVKEDVTVKLTPSDSQSGIAKTYYTIDGSDLIDGTSFTLSQEGIHDITYYTVDKAGNIEATKTAQVKIDKTAPTIFANFNAEYELGSTLNLTYSAQDNLSGIVKEEVIFNGKKYKNGDTVTFYQPGEYTLSIKTTDAAGLTTIIEKTFVVYILIQLDVLPKVIHGNKGIFGVLATLPKGYCSTFDISTVTLNGIQFTSKNWGLQKLGEFGLFKFEREDFEWNPGYVELELRGKLSNGYVFVGKTNALVKR